MDVKSLPYFRRINWRPDRLELRRFAVAMVVGFGLLGMVNILVHRQMTTLAAVLWSVGAGLALASFVPGLGRVAFLAVYVPTSVIGYYVSRIVLCLMFLGVFVPLGVLLKIIGKDLLRLRPRTPRAAWLSPRPSIDSDRYYRQF